MPTVTKVQFISNHSRMRVLRTPAQERWVEELGKKVTIKPELVYEFQDRRLEVTPGRDEIEDRLDEDTGEMVVQDCVEYLRRHPDHGLRFYELTPTAPDPGPLLGEITDAVIAGDAEKLTAIGNEENATWNRPEVMDRIRAALDKLDPLPPEDPPGKKG